jgi:hypothetical protein
MKMLRFVSTVMAAVLVLFLAPLIVSAQDPAKAGPTAQVSFAGKYQSAAKGSGGDALMTLQLADEGGKYSGQLVTPQGQFEIVKGQLADGLLSLDLDLKGSPAKLSLRHREDKLVGEFSRAGQSETIELKKIDEITGEWEAVANINDQNYPFALSLKIEGDKVTGGSSSEVGNATITKGVWNNGRLVLELLGGGGAIILLDATLKDGNLMGNLDFNGQAQGRWVAVRKK